MFAATAHSRAKQPRPELLPISHRRFEYQYCAMQSEPKSSPMEESANRNLGTRVSAANGAHVFDSSCRVVDIHWRLTWETIRLLWQGDD